MNSMQQHLPAYHCLLTWCMVGPAGVLMQLVGLCTADIVQACMAAAGSCCWGSSREQHTAAAQPVTVRLMGVIWLMSPQNKLHHDGRVRCLLAAGAVKQLICLWVWQGRCTHVHSRWSQLPKLPTIAAASAYVAAVVVRNWNMHCVRSEVSLLSVVHLPG